MYTVADDSGFLGIFDPEAYVSFVAEDWTDKIVEHFKDQMSRYRLLLWATGCEASWRVDVCQEASSVIGYRELSGPIIATENRLCLTSYDTLTMGAQFEEISLPEKHEWDLYIPVEPGAYRCRIIQMRDPDTCFQAEDTESPDFVIELLKTVLPSAPWREIPGGDILG